MPLRFLTAGESHGKSLNVIVDGFPSGISINKDFIDKQLQRRQMGYGRGLRMKLETDRVEIQSGIRFGKTLGSPIAMEIVNKDWENWTEKMSLEPTQKKIEKISIPRPGHADLNGIIKYDFNDIRNSIERSSARETAARVAAGSIACQYLNEFGISVGSVVESIGGVYSKTSFLHNHLAKPESINASEIAAEADKSEVRVLDPEQEKKIISKIKVAKKNGDTLGGTIIVVASGLPPGLGSFMQYDTRLDADIAAAMISIQAVKGVEVGAGFYAAEKFGSQVHDSIYFKNDQFLRKTNFAGGIEGGITNGMPLLIRIAMKPIATLMSPIESIDLATFEVVEARRERSDFVAVPACGVIAEAMLAWTLAKHFSIKFGGDSVREVKENFQSYSKKLNKRIKKNFKA